MFIRSSKCRFLLAVSIGPPLKDARINSKDASSPQTDPVLEMHSTIHKKNDDNTLQMNDSCLDNFRTPDLETCVYHLIGSLKNPSGLLQGNSYGDPPSTWLKLCCWTGRIRGCFLEFFIHPETMQTFPGWWFLATPLKNMSSSIGMISNPILMGTCSNWWQPNHPAVSQIPWPAVRLGTDEELCSRLENACGMRGGQNFVDPTGQKEDEELSADGFSIGFMLIQWYLVGGSSHGS